MFLLLGSVKNSRGSGDTMNSIRVLFSAVFSECICALLHGWVEGNRFGSELVCMLRVKCVSLTFQAYVFVRIDI